MSSLELNFRGVDLKVFITSRFLDVWDPSWGHYTVPDGWDIEGIYVNDENVENLFEKNTLKELNQAIEAELRGNSCEN